MVAYHEEHVRRLAEDPAYAAEIEARNARWRASALPVQERTDP
jgi:hypothetical protein